MERAFTMNGFCYIIYYLRFRCGTNGKLFEMSAPTLIRNDEFMLFDNRICGGFFNIYE